MYEQTTLFTRTAEDSTDTAYLAITTGSRLIVTIIVKVLSEGASVSLAVSDAFDGDEAYSTLETLEIEETGTFKIAVSDFNKLIKVAFAVTDGTADFKIAAVVHEASGGSSGEIDGGGP